MSASAFSFLTATEILFGRGQAAQAPARVAALGREVLLVQGPAVRLKQLCDALRKIRGVQQLQLVTTTALLPPLHEQEGAGAPGAREAAE